MVRAIWPAVALLLWCVRLAREHDANLVGHTDALEPVPGLAIVRDGNLNGAVHG